MIEDLPTPPLPDAIMRTGVCVGIDVDGALRLGDRAGALHQRGLGRRVQDAHHELDALDVVERQDGLSDVTFDLGAQRAARRS